jgi:hypothetical protein
MTTDLEIDHGMDHADHMGTETWRRAEVARIEAVLAAPQPIAELA